MSDEDDAQRIILTAIETDLGLVQVALYERHQPGEPGLALRHELTLYEMEHLHTILTRALWAQIRNLI